MDRDGHVPRMQSFRDSETRLQTFEAGLEQRRHYDFHGPVGLIGCQELRAPIDDAAAAFRLYLECAGVLGNGYPGDVRVAEEPLRVVDRLEPFDNFLAVERMDSAELTDACAGQVDPRGQGMPGAAELSDQRPHVVGRRRELNGFGNGLQFRVRRRKIWKILHARLRRPGRTALEELPIAIN